MIESSLKRVRRDAASAAVTTPEAGAWFGDVQKLGTAGFKAIFFDVEES